MTILIHALIFAIIINVYGPELEGFQASGSIENGGPVIVTNNSPTSTTITNDFASVTVSVPSGSTNANAGPLPAYFGLLMSIPFAADEFYKTALSQNPIEIPKYLKSIPDDPVKPSLPGSEPSQYKKDTLFLSSILQETYKNNLKDICNLKSPEGAPGPCAAVAISPNPATCPKCPDPPTNQCAAATFCSIM